MSTETLALHRALEALPAPDASETWSSLTGAPLLVVDVTGADRGVPPDRALDALRRLPCPTVALGEAPPGSVGERFAARCDVAVGAGAELEPVREAAGRNPLACLALVQLLRLGEALDVHEGLVAESLAYSTLQGGPEFASWLAQRGTAAAPPAGDPPLRVERRGDQLDVVLDRPEKRNAYSASMRDALWEALQLAAHDDGIERVVLRGDGPAFCSGGDLDEFGTLPDPATAHAVRCTRHPARLLHALAPRVEVRVQGACVGAGVELPSFAGRVVAARDAWFQLPEVGMGLVPGAGGTVSLPRRVGRQRAAWLALTSARLEAEKALAWGLVDELEG